MDPTFGIDANFMQTNSCKNIDTIKCIGSRLHGNKNDRSFIQWLVQNEYKKRQDHHLFY
jgi:hypothetical protein